MVTEPHENLSFEMKRSVQVAHVMQKQTVCLRVCVYVCVCVGGGLQAHFFSCSLLPLHLCPDLSHEPGVQVGN